MKIRNFKQWYEKQSGYDILNNLEYQKWACENLNKKPDDLMLLTRKNVKIFKQMLGRQTAVYNSEFKHYVWKREFKGYTFLIFTGNKGTSIEIIFERKTWEDFSENKEIGKIIIEFVQWVLGVLFNYAFHHWETDDYMRFKLGLSNYKIRDKNE